jgi:hypothetical protein
MQSPRRLFGSAATSLKQRIKSLERRYRKVPASETTLAEFRRLRHEPFAIAMMHSAFGFFMNWSGTQKGALTLRIGAEFAYKFAALLPRRRDTA